MRKLILALALAVPLDAVAAPPGIDAIARTCNACHGLGGASAGASMPSIGGLPRDYLARVMKQWKYGERGAATMNRIVAGFSDDEIDALAAHFAAQPWVPARQPAAAEALSRGGLTVWRVCTDCHGLNGGDPDIGAPRLDGQWARYMELEVEKYRSGAFRLPHRKMNKAIAETQGAEAAAAAVYFGAQGK